MKNNKKGFMLTETLVVSTLVSVVLVSLYLQFNTVIKNFNRSSNYNKVGDLYALYNVEKIIKKDNNYQFYGALKSKFDNSTKYLEIMKTCNSSNDLQKKYSLSSQNCTTFSDMTNFYGIEKILFTHANPDFKDTDYQQLNDPNLENFIKNIKNQNSNEGLYRLIVKFGNLEYATLVIADGR